MTKFGMLCKHSGLNRWYVRVNGKQVYLGDANTTEEDAQRLLDALKAEYEAKDRTASENDAQTKLGALINLYLNHAKSKGCRKAQLDRTRYVNDFHRSFANFAPVELKPYLIESWLNGHAKWNDTTKANCCKHLSTMFNWLAANDLVTRNPIKIIAKPAAKVRGEEFVITPEEQAKILATCKQPYYDLSVVLWESGARPDEILGCTAAEYKPDQHALVLQDGRAKVKGKRRTILLTAEAERIIRERVERYQHGLLFRSHNGIKIRPDVYNQYLQRRFEEVGIKHPCCPYSYRHSFAVRRIEKGVPLHTVASWLGNTLTVCEKHYAHTLERVRTTIDLFQQSA
jgi:integrase